MEQQVDHALSPRDAIKQQIARQAQQWRAARLSHAAYINAVRSASVSRCPASFSTVERL